MDNFLQHTLILRSSETFAEVSQVVMRRKFDAYLSVAERELFLAGFYDTSHHITVTQRVQACRDPKDNKFLELALCGKAELILSGDNDLLALHPFCGIPILAPAQFNFL